jgi:hypothetical protein
LGQGPAQSKKRKIHLDRHRPNISSGTPLG